MNEGNDGFVRADQIDLKSIDEQLERHLSKVLMKQKEEDDAGSDHSRHSSSFATATKFKSVAGSAGATTFKKQRQEWEIDPSNLIIKSVIARGTFGTVHRGIYDGQDVADLIQLERENESCLSLICTVLIISLLNADLLHTSHLTLRTGRLQVKMLDWGEEGHRTEAEIAALRSAFTQEVAVWHKLEHPNVTKFIGATMGSSELQIQTDNGLISMPSNICCVVVEYLAGGTLKSFLIKNRRRKLAFKVVIQLALDLARGLSYLHSQKVVHRDVKTENMLLDKTRTVKIADFGVARVEASNPNDMTGETGTLGYMAPEVLNGNPYNRKCDVYSFGICLWEIYCCDMPYPDLSFSEITSAVVRQNLRPEIPRCCPSSLANVMKRCWDANPDKRPEMDEVVAMIEAIDTSKGGGMIPVDQQQGCFCFRKHRGP
ncbi:Serine/threonine-protein kinase HT1 [Glycine soja]|nr:Serine/threonine-protein kinase HT1 [Glycine soja]